MKGKNNRIVKEAIMKLEVQNSASCIICYNNSIIHANCRIVLRTFQEAKEVMYKNDLRLKQT